MVDTRISGLNALTGAGAADGDQFVVNDVSDATMAGTGTDKNLTLAQLAVALRTRITAGGDASGALSALVLANTGVSAGTYGDATHSARITVDAKGRIVAVSAIAISGAGGGSPLPLISPGVNGVVGNGTTSDSTAIQTILSANAGQTIFVIEGVYVASGLSLPADTILQFDKGATFKNNNSGTDLLTIGSRSVIRGGKFDGNGFNRNVIVASAAVDVEVDAATCTNHGTAYGLYVNNASDRANIHNCHLISSQVTDSSNMKYQDNWVIGVGAGFADTFSPNTHPIDGLILTGNYFEYNQDPNVVNPDFFVTIGDFTGPSAQGLNRIIVNNNIFVANSSNESGAKIAGCFSWIKSNFGTCTGNIFYVKKVVNNQAVELAINSRVTFTGNIILCDPGKGGSIIAHGVVDGTINNNTIIGAPPVLLSDDVGGPNLRLEFSHNKIYTDSAVISGFGTPIGILVWNNNSASTAGFQEDIDVHHNTIYGPAAARATVGINVSQGATTGHMSRVSLTHNKFINCGNLFVFGGNGTAGQGVSGLTCEDNDADGFSGEGRAIVGSGDPQGIKKFSNNPWARRTNTPVGNATYFAFVVGEEIINTAPALGAAPRWVCDAISGGTNGGNHFVAYPNLVAA